MESFKSKYFSKVIELFNLKNVKQLGKLPENKLTQTINILNAIEKKIFKNFENEENKEELFLNFFTILFYINYKYNKDKKNEMFKNEKSKKYIYQALLTNEDFFTGLTLSKENN